MKRYIITAVLNLVGLILFSQNPTIVKGHIYDDHSNEAMPFVNIQFENTAIGVGTDLEGNFKLETNDKVSAIVISYVGYDTQIIKIKENEINELNISMKDATVNLSEIVITNGKYSNKGNPAVDLIKKVIENKEQNRKEGFEFYSYNKNEKLELSLTKVTEKMKNNLLFRKIKFAFDNADTNQITGEVSWPFFLHENLADVYYSKSLNSKKEYIRAEKVSNFAEFINISGMNQVISELGQEINFYDNNIFMLGLQFISPLNPISPTIYRFYIEDTTEINGTPLVHMYFAPKQKSDLAFMGHLWVALDSNYSLRKIEAGISKDINLNFVNSMEIKQAYDWIDKYAGNELENVNGRRGLMLVSDEISINFGLSSNENSRGIIGKRSTTYRDYNINRPLEDQLFKTKVVQLKDPDADSKSDTYWREHRHGILSQREQGIYTTIDSLRNYKPFKRFFTGVRILVEGYTSLGSIDMGPANTFYSFNTIEGFRLRVGGRTNESFSKNLMLEGYGAYGFRDKKFKGFAGLRYNLGNGKMLRYPYNQLRIWVQEDMKIPGQELKFVQEDNILLSVKRGINDKMFLNRTIGTEYMKEYINGFSYNVSFKNIRLTPQGNLDFTYFNQGERMSKRFLETSEVGLSIRYAPNEKFYEGATYRRPILTKYPILELRYDAGIKGMANGEYNYHRIHFRGEKVFYLAPLGYSNFIVELGKIFGKVPYPLLNIHRANQTYAYQLESYNLMNFMEFASDQYVSINYLHNFGGIFFGRIPLLKKMKWREIISLKSLWGSISEQNTPNTENGLLLFPTQNSLDVNSPTIMKSLGQKPYIEASVGIGNIFKIFRVDYVWRVNYRDLPNAPNAGIRVRAKVEF